MAEARHLARVPGFLCRARDDALVLTVIQRPVPARREKVGADAVRGIPVGVSFPDTKEYVLDELLRDIGHPHVALREPAERRIIGGEQSSNAASSPALMRSSHRRFRVSGAPAHVPSG